MAAHSREAELLETFVALADTLVDDFDIFELLHTLVDRCSTLLEASAAGILLTDSGGTLEVVASTSEGSRLVELMQLNVGSGPCMESADTGSRVHVADVAVQAAHWPEFAESAMSQGFSALLAVPLRLRETTIGSLNLFWNEPTTVEAADADIAQALADVATIGILQERAIRERDVARQQLQRALDSRVVIEQAKGVIAYSRSVDMDQAFALLRDRARSERRPIAEVSADVVERRLRF
ncbi:MULTISPECIES: GAF and ANTAR domain-containing protein [unclassified Leifsonia]|uniref:GAF and ANTAR domain-containing protein n=1 Tax=unclassified Leifsonia TaxID=2663824 RepID=UPI000700A212|nr:MULTISPECIES: GAF and ANTAR domain-containing protein [unclassified Leifsonia]KQX06922.1 transcriptional regulator [Leifsonia sp. Root1293]KRA11206.1 transcriptional regulator [Leifsonia sp. Root60]